MLLRAVLIISFGTITKHINTTMWWNWRYSECGSKWHTNYPPCVKELLCLPICNLESAVLPYTVLPSRPRSPHSDQIKSCV